MRVFVRTAECRAVACSRGNRAIVVIEDVVEKRDKA